MIYHSADYFVHAIAVDSTSSRKKRLFWTAYKADGSGVIVRFTLRDDLEKGSRGAYHETLDGLTRPRAIHLHLKRR